MVELHGVVEELVLGDHLHVQGQHRVEGGGAVAVVAWRRATSERGGATPGDVPSERPSGAGLVRLGRGRRPSGPSMAPALRRTMHKRHCGSGRFAPSTTTASMPDVQRKALGRLREGLLSRSGWPGGRCWSGPFGCRLGGGPPQPGVQVLKEGHPPWRSTSTSSVPARLGCHAVAEGGLGGNAACRLGGAHRGHAPVVAVGRLLGSVSVGTSGVAGGLGAIDEGAPSLT